MNLGRFFHYDTTTRRKTAGWCCQRLKPKIEPIFNGRPKLEVKLPEKSFSTDHILKVLNVLLRYFRTLGEIEKRGGE